jgi:predicted MPP superfamily phosphohydrolase
MIENSEAILNYINSLNRFSPTSLCEKANLTLMDSANLCEALTNADPLRYKKWFRVICINCSSRAYSGEFSELKELKYANCGECGTRFETSPSEIQIYYSNSNVEKVVFLDAKVSARGEDRRSDFGTSLSVLNSLSNQNAIFEIKESIIWHLSDLHYRGAFRFFGRGHCKDLVEHFLSDIKRRSNNLKNDYFVFSGDLTETGSEEDFVQFSLFLNKIISLGANPSNIILVPGNHDSWEGQSHIWLFFRSLFRRESSLLKLAARYKSRNLRAPLSIFNTQSSVLKSFNINNLEIELVAINTCVPNETARGVFPSDVVRPNKDGSFRIAVMHHHLIQPENENYSFGIKHFGKAYETPAMRVINSPVGRRYLYDNGFKMSLHGHKHVQYFKHEMDLNSLDREVLITSSPSLFEKKYDVVRGDSIENNRIGYNIIIPKKNQVDLIQFELKDWNYRSHRVASI